ncbi:glycosyltransferase family 2 protein [Thiocapsa bogorovii]|nr:glycosyltransferase family 2 protein [Thiocapsa bogorovii]UHD18859.1 glycosyltransferase family 2 protein [Thiocapsa bogorovii]
MVLHEAVVRSSRLSTRPLRTKAPHLARNRRQGIEIRGREPPSPGRSAPREHRDTPQARTDGTHVLDASTASHRSVDDSAKADPRLVSIIIANFNYVEFIGTAIASALAQTYPRVEVIVVDDGSTDRSLEEISRFLPAIQCVQVEHQGQIGACAEGFRRSQGDILIFLDADDVLLPDAVERMCHPFVACPDVVKVQGYMSVIDRDGQAMGERIPGRLPDSGDYRALTLRHGLLPLPFAYTSGNAWSRRYLQQVFPLPTVGWLDDYLHDLAPLHGRIESLPETVVEYRIHGNNSWYGSRVLTRQAMQD